MSDPDVPKDPWSQRTKDAWFFGFLTVSALAVAYLFSPFAYTLLFATVVVVVTWPVYRWFLAKMGGRSFFAALATTGVLALIVFGPVGYMVYLFVEQALSAVQAANDAIQAGKLADAASWFVALPQNEMLPEWIRDFLPKEDELAPMIAEPLKTAALNALDWGRKSVPTLLNSTMNAGIEVVIFVFAVISMYMEGPRVLQAFKNLSPMDDAYEERLFEVFREFSNNMVVGAIATALVQGLVAAVGYAIVGVDRIILFSILTAVASFVPVVGTVFIWAPLSLFVAYEEGPIWGVFLAVWSMVFVGQVDALIRPLFMRGSTNIHPLLIFLAVFGGLAWMGLPGGLIGPVLVAFFLALYDIYLHDYLGVPRPPPAPPAGPGWFARWIPSFLTAAPPAPATVAPAPPVPIPVGSPDPGDPGDGASSGPP